MMELGNARRRKEDPAHRVDIGMSAIPPFLVAKWISQPERVFVAATSREPFARDAGISFYDATAQ